MNLGFLNLFIVFKLLIEDNASWLRLNFSHIYQISFQNENFKALQQFCNDIIIKHPNLVFDSDDFTTLQENALISLLKHDELQLDESVIWDKVILWGKRKLQIYLLIMSNGI